MFIIPTTSAVSCRQWECQVLAEVKERQWLEIWPLCFVFLVLCAGVSRDMIPWIKDGVAEMVNRLPLGGGGSLQAVGADPDVLFICFNLYICL